MTNIFKLSLFWFFILNTFYLILAPGTYAATFKFNDSSSTYNQGCTYSADIILDATGESTNAADIIINYDPAKIQIVDSDSVTAGTQIKTGTVFSNYFGNQVNSDTGVIRLTGASFSGTFSSSGVFATIQFKPLQPDVAASFTIEFTGADPYNTLDSNIADSVTSNDLLSSVQNLMFNFTSGSCTADTTAPAITFTSPVNNQQSVPADANLTFTVSDAGSGVDINTLLMTINGVVYNASNPRVTVTGNTAQYSIVLRPIDPILTSQANSFRVQVSDMSGNSKAATITFNIPPLPTYTPAPTPTAAACAAVTSTPTPAPLKSPTPTPTATIRVLRDTTSPRIEFVKPHSKDLIDISPIIIIRVSDAGSGISLNTLKVEIGDSVFTSTDPQSTITGDPQNYLITAKPTIPLSPGSQYVITVFVADNSGNGLSQSIIVKTGTLPNVPLLGFIQEWLTSPTTPPTIYHPTSPTPAKATLNLAGIIVVSIIFISLVFALISFYLWLTSLHSPLKIFSTRSPDGMPLGVVYNQASHEPLSGIAVTITDPYDHPVAQVRTNLYGIFAAALPSGKYHFLIKDPDYNLAPLDTSRHLDYPSPYNGRLLDYQPDSNFYVSIPIVSLKPLPSRPPFGYIKDDKNNPLKSIKLGLKETKFNTLFTIRITDDQGRYRFIVPPGRYQLVLLGKKDKILSTIDTRHHVQEPTIINQDFVI